jgi:hypothetical protein
VLSGEETPLSRHELIDAYIAREINRRTFVRGLMALGVSAGVAASYAVALQPVAAGGSVDPCLYYLYSSPELYELYCTDPGGDPPSDPDPSPSVHKRRKHRRKKGKKKHH